MNSPYFFTTSIGKVRVKTDELVHVHFFPNKFSISGFRQHFKLLDECMSNEKKFYIYSFEDCFLLNTSAQERHHLIQLMESRAMAMSIIISSPMCRAFMKIFLNIARFKLPVKMVKDELAARKFLDEQKGRRKNKAQSA